jgi:hypothetical protein
MSRLSTLALVAVCLCPCRSSALELKNVRPAYGPLGATRQNTKCVPGDSLFITYDIEGLKVNDKTRQANYATTLELFDASGKVAFKQEGQPKDVTLQLGGTRMPGDLFVILPPGEKPGKHKVRLTVKDNLAKETKSFEYAFDVVAPEFAFIGVTARAVGFPGENYSATFALVNTTLDAKNQPSVDIVMSIYDQVGKKLVSPTIVSNLPKDLPDESDLRKENFVPMQFPFYLNRTGNFVIEIMAHDKLTKKIIQLRYPLSVLDFAGAK